MIQPNAKCVVNGKKVNEIALWLNHFIALQNEELDVVDANNTPAKRWFLTGAVPGGVGAAESGDRDNLGGTSGGAAGTGGGASGNRDQLHAQAPLAAAPGGQGGVVPGGITISMPRGSAGADPTSGQPPSRTDAGADAAQGGESIPLSKTTGQPMVSGDLSQTLPSKNGMVDMPALKSMVENGTASPYQQDMYKKMGGESDDQASQERRQAGESNAEFLARKAASGDGDALGALTRQLEADMYSEKLKEAQEMSRNAGVSFNLSAFNAQWERQSETRAKDVMRQAQSMQSSFV